MRHRNEEDDFIVVKSTGQRVVFVAIIFVAPTHPQSLSATLFFFLFPSCVATLNPTTEVNPKCFFFLCSLFLFFFFFVLEYKIGFFTFFFSRLCVCSSCWGLVQKRRRRKCIIGCFDWERERENVLLRTHTRILAKIKRSFYSYFSHLEWLENDDFSDDSDDGDVLFFFASSSSSSATRTRRWEDDDQRTGGVLQEQR